MSGAKADAELRSKTDNLERMITEVEKLMMMILMLLMVTMVMEIKTNNLERMITKVEKLSGSDSGSNGIGSGREVKKYIR